MESISGHPGHYSWKIIGEDIKIFIENVIKQKVIISGNSSGGIIALSVCC